MKPLLLFSGGSDDADFLYATGFAVEEACYVRFADGDDVLLVPRLELERARQESTAKRVIDRAEAGWQESTDSLAQWAKAAANVLGERQVKSLRISPRLAVVYYQAFAAAGLEMEIDGELFRQERRRKHPEQASYIHSAQRAAEAACAEVIAHLAVAEIDKGLLWLDGRPLTSERLMAKAQAVLNEIGYTTPEMIIAGSPGCALPHFRGAGQIRANAPVIIDIFPRGTSSHYHGDLTRTVVVGEVPAAVQRMHDACVQALETGIGLLRAGANGRDVHRAACQVLVDAGFGTTTAGYEGNRRGPVMNHSLGHGVGLDVHEAPSLRDLDYPLEAGDVVTVEPGLYQEGLGGVRVEDTGLVTPEGFQNFTSLPRSLDPRAYL